MKLWPHTFRNDAEEAIPPFAILRITGVVEVKEQTIYLAKKPNATEGSLYGVNGPIAVQPKKYGAMAFDGPLDVARKTSDGPVANLDKIGSKAGEWLARTEKQGGREDFLVVGERKATDRTAVVIPIWCA